jgi:guanine deaminase
MKPIFKIILCDILNPINDKRCIKVRKGAIVLKKQSKKLSDDYKILDYGTEKKMIDTYGHKKSCVVKNRSGQLCLPGFIDTHFHWVQDDVRLMPKESLLLWLEQHTWPYEAKFKSKKYSLKRSHKFRNELLQVGTLGGAVYGSIHGHTVDDALNNFIGDYTVGNVLMTQNSPSYLTQSASNAKKLTKHLSAKYKHLYAVTPRFAPTTCPEVMTFGAAQAKKNGSFIQTHLSETEDEIDYVLSLFKNVKGFEKIKTYTGIYKKCGLLSKKTIMGHGIHLSDEELVMLSKSKTSIAHCPSSNAPTNEKGLGSGLFSFKRIEKAKIHWALASDIGGGPFLSMFDVMRSFVNLNKKAKVSGATYTKALYRSTLAGAKSLNQEKHIGNLDKKKWANFILVPSPKYKKGETAESILKSLTHVSLNKRSSYQDLVLSTWYRGKEVFNRNELF